MSEMWRQLDHSTSAIQIDGIGCIVRTSAGICFVPDVKIENGSLVADPGEEAEENGKPLPQSANDPGWPQQITNADESRYYRVYEADPQNQQQVAYARMFSKPGMVANYDREFLYVPMNGQKEGNVQFERIAFATLPEGATCPK